MNRSYLHRVGDSLSQLFNTAVLFGDPDESTSGRSYREQNETDSHFWWFMYNLINGLFYWQEDHCADAYYTDLDRAEDRVLNSNRWRNT